MKNIKKTISFFGETLKAKKEQEKKIIEINLNDFDYWKKWTESEKKREKEFWNSLKNDGEK